MVDYIVLFFQVKGKKKKVCSQVNYFYYITKLSMLEWKYMRLGQKGCDIQLVWKQYDNNNGI